MRNQHKGYAQPVQIERRVKTTDHVERQPLVHAQGRVQNAFFAPADDQNGRSLKASFGDNAQQFDAIMLAERQIDCHRVERGTSKQLRSDIDRRRRHRAIAALRGDHADNRALQDCHHLR